MTLRLGKSEIITAPQAMDLVGVTLATIHEWRKKEVLNPVCKIGHAYLFDRKQVLHAADIVVPRRPRRGTR